MLNYLDFLSSRPIMIISGVKLGVLIKGREQNDRNNQKSNR
jgi:hypothetical protein